MPSFTLSVTSGGINSTVAVVMTGVSTSWVSGTLPVVTGGLYASYYGATVNVVAQTISFNLNAGQATGTLTIGNTTDGSTATFTVNNYYYLEPFDADVSPPALPSGLSVWSPSTATVVTSSAHTNLTTNSLAISPGNKIPYVWFPTVDNNYGSSTVSFLFQFTGTFTGSSGVAALLRAQAGVSSSSTDPQCYELYMEMHGSSGIEFVYNSGSSGVLISGGQYNPTGWSALWAAGTSYYLEFTARDISDATGSAHVQLILSVQRQSDGAWLVNGGSGGASWVATGAPTPVFSVTTGAQAGAGLAAVGAVSASGLNVFYVNNIQFNNAAVPANINSLPTWTPGASVELGGTYISIDSGTSALSGVSDGNFATSYASTATLNGWAGLDLGSGNSAVLTRAWISPTVTGSLEYIAPYCLIEGSNDATNVTWAPVGTSCDLAISRYFMVPCPVTPGTAYRYFRFRNPVGAISLAEIRFEGTVSAGTPSSQPVRPTILPATWKMANGSTITITTPTSGASIYYTTDGTTPTFPVTGTTTLYTGAVTLPSNAVTTIGAIAYKASLSTTTSAVTVRTFTCPQEFIPDTGVTGLGTTNNQCETLYDQYGIILIADYGSTYFVGSTMYTFGTDLNLPNTGTGTIGVTRASRIYQSTDWYNFNYYGKFLEPPAIWLPANNPARIHIHKNPNPINPNNAYVAVGVLDIVSTLNIGFFTAPAVGARWSPVNHAVPNGFTILDDDGLIADPQTGTLWSVADGSASVITCQIDPATDFTSFTGSNITIDSSGNQDAPTPFYLNGTYFFTCTAGTNFGAGNARWVYKAVTASSWAAAAAQMNAINLHTMWATTPGSATVAYNAQIGDIRQVPGYQGFICTLELCAPGESPFILRDQRTMFIPLPWSQITTGVSPAIAMTPTSPWSWTYAGSFPVSIKPSVLAAMLLGF